MFSVADVMLCNNCRLTLYCDFEAVKRERKRMWCAENHEHACDYLSVVSSTLATDVLEYVTELMSRELFCQQLHLYITK